MDDFDYTGLEYPPYYTYVPRWIRQESDMEYGSVVTHENYNAKLNLNTTQGDYNTAILNLLFNGDDSGNYIHIPYIDSMIETAEQDLNDKINTEKERIDNVYTDISGVQASINNIINGVTAVGKAVQAEQARSIMGVDTAGNRQYYGTDSSGTAGFHLLPDALYATDIGDTTQATGIYIVPQANSVAESMLTPAVREKLNRESISNYNDLQNRPYINNVLLTGNLSLSDLGIQPEGNYLTEVPNTYATKSYVDDALIPYITTSDATSAFVDYTTYNADQQSINNSINNVSSTRNRVFVQSSTPSNAQQGDLWVNV